MRKLELAGLIYCVNSQAQKYPVLSNLLLTCLMTQISSLQDHAFFMILLQSASIFIAIKSNTMFHTVPIAFLSKSSYEFERLPSDTSTGKYCGRVIY